MLQDGIKFTDTSTFVNMVVDHGTTLPATSTSRKGELFFQEGVGLFVFSGTSWTLLNDTVTSVNSKTGDVVLSTSDITEGINQYFTQGRARASISATGDVTYNSATGVISFVMPNTDSISEGTTNKYFTNARARGAIGVTGNGGLSYDSTTGIFTYTTPTTDVVTEGTTNKYFTNARARSAFVAGTNITIDSSTGTISATTPQSTPTNQITTSFFPGSITPMTGTVRWYAAKSLTLKSVVLTISTAPSTAVTVDILKNGTSIFSGNAPSIAAGQNISSVVPLSISMAATDYLTINILTASGSDMAVRIEYL